MSDTVDLRELVGDGLASVFEHLDEGILVMDAQRCLRFVNERARRLLGYRDGDVVAGRCRLTTRGIDCQNSCPLTFALEGNLTSVERFSAVYRGRDDVAVSVHVTVLPFRDGDGEFTGAVEILRPADPDPGFVACGRGEASLRFRREIGRLARGDGHLLLVGDEPACADVAAAIHGVSGLDDELFHRWGGTWDGVNPWPPGTVYGYGKGAIQALDGGGSGWRVVVGLSHEDAESAEPALPVERLVVPDTTDLDGDLPAIVASWVDRMRSSLKVAPEALERLCTVARSAGWSGLESVLTTAVSAAGDRLEDSNIPVDSFQTVVLDEVLSTAEPLATLEKRLLVEVLERCSWRMQDAADRLGMSRVTLWRKLKDHGIERPSNGDE